MMKAMGSGKRGPLAGIAQAMGFGGGAMPSPEQMKALAEKMPGGQAQAACRRCRRNFPPGLRRACRTCQGSPASAASRPLPGLGGFPGKKK